MDTQTRKLVENRLAWMIEGEYWLDKDLEDCVEAPHIDPKSPDDAEIRAKKILDIYLAENPIPRKKRSLKNNDRIWERRFGKSIEESIEECLTEIDRLGLKEMAVYLDSPS